MLICSEKFSLGNYISLLVGYKTYRYCLGVYFLYFLISASFLAIISGLVKKETEETKKQKYLSIYSNIVISFLLVSMIGAIISLYLCHCKFFPYVINHFNIITMTKSLVDISFILLQIILFILFCILDKQINPQKKIY
jgi:hypothetical protein